MVPDEERHARLRRLLGADGMRWLVDRARARLGGGRPLEGRVALRGASVEQQRALATLIGRPVGLGDTLSVRLEEVDAVLRRSGVSPDGLAAAVVELTGPVVDQAGRRAAQERSWAALHGEIDAAVAARPVLAEWAAGLRRTGGLRRASEDVEQAAEIVRGVVAVLRALPGADEPVGVFARRVLGRAHALDEDEPVCRLVLPAVAVLAGRPDGAGAAWRREVWAAVGVLRDDLSSTVLTLGLPGDDRTATGRVLAACAEVGQPAVLTLRQLVHDPPLARVSGHDVWVCEGPVVVSVAADRLGARCAPLVCTAGQPGTATLRLLGLLDDGGARLHYHGDFDWGGVRIANRVFAAVPARPWRFDAAAYREAARSTLAAPLTGRRAEASWDPALAAAMVGCGRQVEEEAVVDDLVADLDPDARPSDRSGRP